MPTQLPRALAAAGLVCVLVAAGAAQAPPFRLMNPMVPAGAGPALGLADFDLDGDVDLLTNGTGIWMNDGNGRFAQAPVVSNVTALSLNFYAFTPLPVVAIGKLNGDFYPDVLAFDGTPNTIQRWSNLGGGVLLSSPMAMSFGSAGVRSIALGDVDGDGDQDAVFALYWPDTFGTAVAGPLQLYRNDGAGSFNLDWGALPTQLILTPQLALRDFDADGDLDILVSADTNAVTNQALLILNNGAGAFSQTPIVLPTAPGQNIFAVGDVNGDGLPDIVSDSMPPNQCSIQSGPKVLLNGGGGSFSPMPGVLQLPLVGAIPRLADLDGDGRADLVRVTVQGASCHLLGAGTLLPPDSVAALFAGSLTITPFGNLTMACGDVDGDGDDDFLANTGQSGTVAFNDGLGALVPIAGRLAAPPALLPNSCDAMDFDGDGDVDLLLGFSDCPGTSQTSPAVHVALNDGRGNLTQAAGHPIAGAPSPPNPGARVFLDADGDGDTDCVVATGVVLSQAQLVLTNTGTDYQVTQTLPGVVGAAISVLKAGDIDGDGDVDLVTGTHTWGLAPAASHVLKNDGTGVFQVAQSLAPAGTQDVVLVDVENDGDLDIVQANTSGSRLYLNDGSGAFSLAIGFPAVAASSVTTADIDGDMDVDVMLDNAVLINDGAGVFWVAGTVTIPNWLVNSMTFELLDVDQDGNPDLVDSKGRLYRNLGGAMAFTNPEDLPAQLTTPIVHADFDGDGDRDLLARGPAILTNMTRQLSPGLPARPGRLASLEIGAAPGTQWLLFASLGTGNLPLPPLGTVRLDLASLQLGAVGTIPPGGMSTLSGTAPSGPGAAGLTVWWQAVMFEPAGPRATGLEVTAVTEY